MLDSLSQSLLPLNETRQIEVPKLYVFKKIGGARIQRLLLKAGVYDIFRIEPKAGAENQFLITLKHPWFPEFTLYLGKRRKIDTTSPYCFAVGISETTIMVSAWGDFNANHLLLEHETIQDSWNGSLVLKKENEEEGGFRNAQIGAIHSVMSHWSVSEEPGTVVLPTGTGKTETMLGVTVLEQAELVLVIVPSVDLKAQISDKFINLGILSELGILSRNAKYPIVATLASTIGSEEELALLAQCNVIVSTPLLIAGNLDLAVSLAKRVTHVFFDEAHHLAAAKWRELKKVFSESKIIQFTATPYRRDRQPIEGKVLYQYPLELAQRDGCFSSISLITIEERNPDKKDLVIAHAAYAQLLEDRVNGFSKHCMMVRSASRERAQKLFELYRSEFPEEHILLMHTGTLGKAAKIEELKQGKYSIVVCVDMLKEGFDYPEFKIAAVHDLHKSLAVTMQFIGRFTRDRIDLGAAHMVVNFAESEIPPELERLYAEGSGWDKVISEVAQSKQDEAIEFIQFLSNCHPYKAFDDPDQQISPRLVNPSLCCVVYRCQKVDWSGFEKAFPSKHRFSQPYVNDKSGLFYFATQTRERVKWTRSEAIRDQVWNLIMLHHCADQGLLYVGCSDSKFRHEDLVKEVAKSGYTLINLNPVFRCFDNIKRLKIIHAGLLKPANRNHRYSKFSGADVTKAIQDLQDGRTKKSDFVGAGYRDGFPVGVGASQKGKVWNPVRVGNPKEWIEWCQMTGAMLVDQSIDADQLLRDSAEVIQLNEFPQDLRILAMDWNEEIFHKFHKIGIKSSKGWEVPLFMCEFTEWKIGTDFCSFVIRCRENDSISLRMSLESEDGHVFIANGNEGFLVTGWSRDDQPLELFFRDFPPTMHMADGSLIAGCQHTRFQAGPADLPVDFFDPWDWSGVDITTESVYKSSGGKIIHRGNSVQQMVLEKKKLEGAILVFNDDGSGESADVVAVFDSEETITIQLLHCKFSKGEKAGHRVADLYEVCGQAVKSVKWKWDPRALFKHLRVRSNQVLSPQQRYFHGDNSTLSSLLKSCDFKEVEFEFWVVQPGLNASEIPNDIKTLLGSCLGTISDMTECRLRFISC